MYITCKIPCQRLFGPNLTFIGAVLGRSFEEKKLLWIVLENRRSDEWRIHFLVKLPDELCLTACLSKIKVLLGKHVEIALHICSYKHSISEIMHF